MTRRPVVALVALAALAGCGASHRPTAPVPSTNPRSSTTLNGPVSTAPRPTSALPDAVSQRAERALPYAIQEAAAAALGRLLYVVGGYDGDRNSSAAVAVYDGSSWSAGPPLPIAVNHPGAAAIGHDLYAAGGFTPAGASDRVFVLTRGAQHWREAAAMHHARGALALLSLGGRLYAIGGRDGDTQVASTEEYDPATDTWSELPDLPSPRNHVAGYPAGGAACVAGGRTPATSSAIDCLDPTTRAWRSAGTLPIPTSGAAAATLNGVTLVAGGEPSGETSIVGDVQTRRSGVWTQLPMLVPRHGTAFAIYRGRLWMCGGATAPGFQAVPTCTSLVA